MNEKCKYCDYVLKCSRFCEYNSIMCLIHRSFPKIVDKTYEELEKENKEYKEVIDTLEFIKARAKEGATQETINKLAITFVNKYLKGVG